MTLINTKRANLIKTIALFVLVFGAFGIFILKVINADFGPKEHKPVNTVRQNELGDDIIVVNGCTYFHSNTCSNSKHQNNK